MMAAPTMQQAPDLAKTSAFFDRMELTLNEEGMICDCDIPVGEQFGYLRSELAWRHISVLLPELAKIRLMRDGQINPRLSFLCHIGHRFQLASPDGKPCEGRLFIRDAEVQGRHDLRIMIFPAEHEPGDGAICA